MIACLVSASADAAPPEPDSSKTASAPAKTPAQIQDDLLALDMKAFDEEEQAAKASENAWVKVIDNKSPEEAALAKQQSIAAQFQLQIAAAAAADARNLHAQALAAEATMPEYARNLRNQAARKVEIARAKVGEAREVYNPPPPVTATSPNAAPLATACAALQNCRLLKIMEKKVGENVGEFDGSAFPVDPSSPRPSADRILRGTFQQPPKLTPGGEVLVLPKQTRVDLRPLRDAVAEVAPAVARRPLILEDGARPSREFLRLLADEDMREELERIGGVSLGVTFDLLAASGISELRGGMDITLIEDPVMVSLKALASAAEPWLQDWNHAPASIRYPGNLGRVHGMVLAADGSDFFLVGSPAARPEARIDIDIISILLRTIWRDGKVPAVSLDPRPDQIGGPQYPRIMQIPPDSVVASVMVEADYAMKAINLGAGWAGPLDLIGVQAILARTERSADPSLARYWLTPKKLGPTQFYRSNSDRTVLFDSAVQVQTETMFVQNGQIVGMGAKGLANDDIAAAFTQAYRALESDPRVQPSVIFARLHGVVDMATLAQVIRSLEIAPAVLGKIADLPYRRLTGNEALPTSFPGLSQRHELSSGVLLASGGAQLSVRQEATLAPRYSDHVGGGLETAVDRWSGGVSEKISASFAMPQAEDSKALAVDDEDMLAAVRALEREEWSSAHAYYTNYITRYPEQASGYYGMARALIGAGRLQEAILPVARAILLDPDDPTNQMLLHDLAWQIDPVGTKAILSVAEAKAIGLHYTQLGLIALGRDKRQSAESYADMAIRIDPDNGEAHLIRAFLAPPTSQQRELSASLAIRSFRRRFRAGDTEAGLSTAVGLQIVSAHHFQRGLLALQEGRPLVAVLLLRGALEEAREAERADPNLADATAVRVSVSAYLDQIADPQSAVSRKLLDEADALIVRFPQQATTHWLRAQLAALGSHWNEALEHAGRATELTPNDPSLRAFRARIEAARGNCVGATAEFGQARRLAGARLADFNLDKPPACIPR